MALHTRGKVPHFSMRPHPGVTIALIIILISGLLGSMSLFSMEEGTGEFRQKGMFTLIATILISIMLTFVATSKIWFPHLWKKNSTHKRHHQHTRHHPVMQEKEFRKRR
jgi:hypothetical protein